MGEFFLGWRRKIGVVTLMSAVVAMGGWVRSLTNADQIEFRHEGTNHIWFIGKGFLGWESDADERAIAHAEKWRLISTHYRFSPELNFGIEKFQHKGWTWAYLGFHVWRQHKPDCFECHVRFSSIVIPLTLLSAFLLLSKPRNSTSDKINESVSNEEA